GTIFSAGTGSLTMLAHNNITLNAAITLLLGNATFTADLDNDGAGSIAFIGGADLRAGGNAILNAINVDLRAGTSITASNITINNEGTFFSFDHTSLNRWLL